MVNMKIYQKMIDGTAFRIDGDTSIALGAQLFIAGAVMLINEPLASFALVLMAGLPFIHEIGHYLIARDHGLEVESVSFERRKFEVKVNGMLTHRDVMDISFAGVVASGLVFSLTGLLILVWGYLAGSPFALVALMIPVVWGITLPPHDSDFHVGMRAYQYHKAQQGKDWFGGALP